MQSKLQKQINERNKNVISGEILIYSDQSNYNKYMVVSDQEVLTGDIMIVDLNDEGTFDKYGESQQIININSLQYGWQLKTV